MMPKSTLSRRSVLKSLAGVPMLPLAAPLSALAASDDLAPAARFVNATFRGMPAPGLDAPKAMATTSVASSLDVSYADGSKASFRLAYEPFFTTGDAVPDGRGGTVVAGGYFDIQGRPIVDRSVPGRERQFFSDSPDGTSLLTVPGARVPGVKGRPVFAVVQFEYTTR